jgi:hypothetical protein
LAVESPFFETNRGRFPQAVPLFDRGAQGAHPARRVTAFIAKRIIDFIGGAVYRELFGPGRRRHDQRADKRNRSNGKSPASTPPKHPVDQHAETLTVGELMSKFFISVEKNRK